VGRNANVQGATSWICPWQITNSSGHAKQSRRILDCTSLMPASNFEANHDEGNKGSNVRAVKPYQINWLTYWFLFYSVIGNFFLITG